MSHTDTAAGLEQTNDLPFTAPLRIGTVTLSTRNLDDLSRYYEHVVGLRVLHRDTRSARLGAGDTALIELNGDPAAEPSDSRSPGLFHTAFLLPTRNHLALWAKHAVDNRFFITGASDHSASEAIYLRDPEGNGIEIYADRPSSEWRLSRDGQFEMTTEPLDVRALISEATGRWNGMPDNGTVGHVHLKVGALEPAEAFYSEVLGFDVSSRISGASFFGSGGYHHQIATNVWGKTADRPHAETAAGLAAFEIIAEESSISAIRDRAQRAAIHVTDDFGTLTLRDPWNIPVKLRPSQPSS